MAERRLQSLDVLRGIAILLICMVNVPEGMGNTLLTHGGNPRLSGWSSADAVTWYVLHNFVEGTQRGLLQILLGASLILLIPRNATATGGSAMRVLISRYAVLALFGLADILLLGWVGDILLEYSVAALIAIPFRKLSSRWLIGIGACFAMWTLAQGMIPNDQIQNHRLDSTPHVQSEPAPSSTHPPTLTVPHVTPTSQRTDAPIASFIATEQAAHLGGSVTYLAWASQLWRTIVLPNRFVPGVIASVFTILLGMGLFKLGFTQGAMAPRAYLRTAVVGLALGLGIRIVDSQAILAHEDPPRLIAAAGEISRLALTLAYAAILNLMLQGGFGRVLRLVAPAGRTAFSLYLLQNFVFIFLVFNGGGLALFGQYSWFGLTMITLASLPIQIACSTLWLSRFDLGPMEWIWRSLVYRRLVPLRRQ